MLNENRLYSISLGVASLQDGLVCVATALSPAMAGHFKFLLHHFFVRLGLTIRAFTVPRAVCSDQYMRDLLSQNIVPSMTIILCLTTERIDKPSNQARLSGHNSIITTQPSR